MSCHKNKIKYKKIPPPVPIFYQLQQEAQEFFKALLQRRTQRFINIVYFTVTRMSSPTATARSSALCAAAAVAAVLILTIQFNRSGS